MSTKSETLKTSCGSKAQKYGFKPTEPKGSAEGVIEVGPQSGIPGQVFTAGSAGKSKETVP
jgi:hypothetical protein